jgi:hypothetical protein
MTRGRLLTPMAVLLTVGAAAHLVRADETPCPAQAQTRTKRPPPRLPRWCVPRPPTQYGDMAQVVDAARPVAEGTLSSTVGQRARALRFLGIGLFLTSRALGADNAFAELLRVDPTARLDPTTTRPEVVVFFENIRHQHVARERASRHFIWNLLPPGGQFQNDDTVKGWIVGGVEFAAIATIVRRQADQLFLAWPNTTSTARTDRTTTTNARCGSWNGPARASSAAAYLYGVIDGIVHYYRPPDELRQLADPADFSRRRRASTYLLTRSV